MRSIGWLAVAATLALAAGCAGRQERPEAAAVQAAASTGTGIWAIPEMRAGRAHRERGAVLMETAYRYRDALQRENAFARAWNEFKAAEDDYHAALVVAPARFKSSVDTEIQSVAGLMKQIQRDRETKLD